MLIALLQYHCSSTNVFSGISGALVCVTIAHLVKNPNIFFSNKLTVHYLKTRRSYRIAQNAGSGKHWRIWQIDSNSPK